MGGAHFEAAVHNTRPTTNPITWWQSPTLCPTGSVSASESSGQVCPVCVTCVCPACALHFVCPCSLEKGPEPDLPEQSLVMDTAVPESSPVVARCDSWRATAVDSHTMHRQCLSWAKSSPIVCHSCVLCLSALPSAEVTLA